MKGTLHKTEQGWIVIYDEIIGENIAKKNQNSLPLHPEHQNPYNGLIDDSQNEGKEVEFVLHQEGNEDNIKTYAKILTKCYCGHTSYCDCGLLPEEAELKNWDVTLNDGLEDETHVSDDSQIGPDGAYEHTEDWPEDTTPREKAKSELINLLFCQIMDLTTMSKIELGDDVIAEIRRLNEIIKIGEQEIEKLLSTTM